MRADSPHDEKTKTAEKVPLNGTIFVRNSTDRRATALYT